MSQLTNLAALAIVPGWHSSAIAKTSLARWLRAHARDGVRPGTDQRSVRGVPGGVCAVVALTVVGTLACAAALAAQFD